jgi:hypothetical protein
MYICIYMNGLSSVNSLHKHSRPSAPVVAGNVYIVNSNFSANNPPNQTGLTDTTFTNVVTGWTKTGGISTGTAAESANDVRVLNNLRANNASPRFWNATLSTGVGGNLLTGLYIAQNTYSSLPKIFSVSQTITFPVAATYNCRFWAAPRTGDTTGGGGNYLRNDLYNSTQSISMSVGSTVIGPKTFAITNALTPTGYYPGFELVTGSVTTTVANESRVLKLEWRQTGNNNSCIIVTGIEINRAA